MTHTDIASIVHRHAVSHRVDAQTLLGRELPQSGMLRHVAARRAAMAELRALGMPIYQIARLFRLTWQTAQYHINKTNDKSDSR